MHANFKIQQDIRESHDGKQTVTMNINVLQTYCLTTLRGDMKLI